MKLNQSCRQTSVDDLSSVAALVATSEASTLVAVRMVTVWQAVPRLEVLSSLPACHCSP
jgi:hypothetical protein